MAASAGRMVNVSDESSSSEDEALERLKEAVWNTESVKPTDGESNGKPSRRLVVSEHKHDGNELQVTPEFQAHIAKKLGHMLDSYISEMPAETSSHAESTKCDDNDEGFRLFATSVPGQTVDDPPPTVRRRPAPSSSDSDSEMEARLKEAAVSVRDLLPTSSLPNALSSSSVEAPCSENMKKKRQAEEGQEETPVSKKKKKKKKKRPQEESEGGAGKLEKRQEYEEVQENPAPKKKKKRKLNEEGSEQVSRKCHSTGSSDAQRHGENENLENDSIQLEVKRKKQKKQKAMEGNSKAEASS
ncbi:protein CUSTOS isoform 2-T2 [Polymixia lowei]